MLTGRKPFHAVPDGEAIHSSRLWLAMLLAGGLAAGLSLIIIYAPAAAADAGDF
jgi:hypothetical protein